LLVSGAAMLGLPIDDDGAIVVGGDQIAVCDER